MDCDAEAQLESRANKVDRFANASNTKQRRRHNTFITKADTRKRRNKLRNKAKGTRKECARKTEAAPVLMP